MAVDPTTIRGYMDRWRASTLTGADGTTIASWASDGGLAVTQGTAAAQPTLQTDASARRMVRFDGVDDVLHTASSTALNGVTGSTLYWVLRPVSYPATGTQQGFYISVGGDATKTRHIIRIQSSKHSAGGRRLDADAFAAVSGPNNVTTGSAQVHTSSADYGNAKISMWLDGSAVFLDSAFQTAGSTSATNPASLRFCGATASGFSNLELYEALLYQTVHTAEERAQVHTYIQDTYGISVVDYVSTTTVSPAGIASAEAVGSPTVTAPAPAQTVSPAGITSLETLGSPSVTSKVVVGPAGIASTESVGGPTVSPGPVVVTPDGIATAEVVGSPSAVPGAVIVSPDSVLTAESVGSPGVTSLATVSPNGIASSGGVGSPAVSPGPAAITPDGVATAEVLGSPSVTSLATVSPSSVAGSSSVGSPTLTTVITISPAGVVTAGAVGEPAVSLKTQVVYPDGIGPVAAASWVLHRGKVLIGVGGGLYR